MSFSDHPVMAGVRKALGHARTPLAAEVPAPPPVSEPLVRLVHTDLGLPELFGAKARENKMGVTFTSADEVARRVVERAKDMKLRSVLVPGGGGATVLERLGVVDGLAAAGVAVHRWESTTLDESYEIDAGLTDAWAGVAETGSVVIRASAEHGRAISLMPAYHLVVIEPRVLVADLVDLFEKMGAENASSGVVIISGPSKTADIEMNLVTGVHGPGQVDVFVLR